MLRYGLDGLPAPPSARVGRPRGRGRPSAPMTARGTPQSPRSWRPFMKSNSRAARPGGGPGGRRPPRRSLRPTFDRHRVRPAAEPSAGPEVPARARAERVSVAGQRRDLLSPGHPAHGREAAGPRPGSKEKTEDSHRVGRDAGRELAQRPDREVPRDEARKQLEPLRRTPSTRPSSAHCIDLRLGIRSARKAITLLLPEIQEMRSLARLVSLADAAGHPRRQDRRGPALDRDRPGDGPPRQPGPDA